MKSDASKLRLVGGLTLIKIISALLGIFYSMVQVRYFGSSRTIEIVFAAQSLVYLITSLTQSGQLAEIFLPEYIKAKNEYGQWHASIAYSVLINWITFFLAVILLIAYFTSPFLVDLFVPGFGDLDRVQCVIFFRAFLPLIFLQVHSGFLNTVLNAEGIYGRQEFTSVVNTVISVVLLLLLYDTLGAWAIVISLYIGKSIEILVGIWYLYKADYRYSLRFKSDYFSILIFLKKLIPTSFYVCATQVLNWAITSTISHLPSGYFAIFQYVQRLIPKLNGVFVVPVSTIFFTKAAEKIYSNDTVSLKKDVTKALSYAFFTSSIISAILVVTGKEILNFLWSSKSFDESKVDTAYSFFLVFVLVFISKIGYGLVRKLAVASGFSNQVYTYKGLGQLFSSLLILLLVQNWAVDGLLASIFIKEIIFVSIPFIICSWKIDYFDFPSRSFLAKLSFMFIISIGVIHLFNWSFFDNMILGESLSLSKSFRMLLLGILKSSLTLSVYLSLGYVLKVNVFFELRELFSNAISSKIFKN